MQAFNPRQIDLRTRRVGWSICANPHIAGADTPVYVSPHPPSIPASAGIVLSCN